MVVLCLPGGQASSSPVEGEPVVLRKPFDFLFADALCVVEQNLQALGPEATLFSHQHILSQLHPVRHEHVVRSQDFSAVELDRRESIEALEHKYGMGEMRSEDMMLLRDLERRLVQPGLFADPLHGFFVLREERIRDDSIVHEVQMDLGGQRSAGLP